MKITIIMVGMFLMGACGMPDMPERMPMSERLSQVADSSGDGGSSTSVPGETSGGANENGASGASSPTSSAGAKPAAAVKATAMPLVINEILYDVPGEDTNGDLFVELKGAPGGDLGGYKINFINGDDGKKTEDIIIPAGLLVPENGLFVIADGITGDLQHTHVMNADYLDNFDPQNGPDSVQLISFDGKLIDAVSYGTPKMTTSLDGLGIFEGVPAPDAPMGKSISRLPDAEDTNDNSVDFVINDVPSPGEYDVAGAL